jgi:hypothetical protein
MYVGQHNFRVHENTVYIRRMLEWFTLELEVGVDEAHLIRVN